MTSVKFVVLDEADRMLDMGFIDDVDYILSKTPQHKQMMMFSATMPRAIIEVARHHMREDFATILVGKDEEPVVNTISHSYAFAKGRMKFAALFAYIDQMKPKKCIIFSRTKHESELIHELLLKKGLDAMLLHGGLTQARREYSLRSFRERTPVPDRDEHRGKRPRHRRHHGHNKLRRAGRARGLRPQGRKVRAYGQGGQGIHHTGLRREGPAEGHTERCEHHA